MLKKLISTLIDTARTLGLGVSDLDNAQDLLDNREYGLAFDTIITQLYEYEIEIDKELYDLIDKMAQKMDISESGYSFMQELIREENIVPKPVKDKLAEILKNIEVSK
ncbi:MafI family immunity protein [Reichenbachiella carrageenanivorans]|uniref:MafI family immunity protein n=1 Tax=Reichenbachiella carrageenanivorans TaxID=2979869 RepID=A0ABY6D0W6_9BACT|nr:MafI family immunity protein [Reichenbachiella carrageenanivorans]UXX79797.1 MafI family immunity protein [Reichenbachiella carrageenanivorans]